ncbi:MAG: LacI family DNA-binding transcriptional regulator, partial [Victivallales bacterium]|nr:LacI family DNA-binding transcriptional regulator [Victivallales bacterium]
ANRQNLRIPEDLSIIGYDNVSWPDGRYMGLTTIEQPTFKIGETALELLNTSAESMQPVGSALIQGTLVERNSVK